MSSHHTLEMVRQLAGQFAERAAQADQLSQLPAEDVAALRASGYLALNVPTEYGGAGLSMRDCIAAQLELAQGSGSSALVAGMQMQVLGDALDHAVWRPGMLARLCREAAAGSLINSVATEPQLGSPARGAFYATTAQRTDTSFIINGHKTWATGGRHLTHMLVKVTLDDNPVAILVEGHRPGLEWVPTWGHGLSLRATDSHDVYFNNVEVPLDNLVQDDNAGDKKSNAWFPLVLAATYLGIALAARHAVVRYTLERVPTALGRPIATLPSIQRQLGELDIPLMAARSLLLEVAGEGPYPDMARVAAAKHHAIVTANDATQKALQIAGGASLTRALPLERYFRDVRAGMMQPPSGDKPYEIVGQAAIATMSPGGVS